MTDLIVKRVPVIGVMGSGTTDDGSRSEIAGSLVAKSGAHLLTGGGQGSMAAVCRAFCGVKNRIGLCIGILPGDEKGKAPPGYPNPWVEIVIQTHLPLSGRLGTDVMSRNHINILSADAVIVLQGGAGTLSEIELAIRYKKRIVIFSDDVTFPALPQQIDRADSEDQLMDFLASVI